jgi:hypothetical protein
MEFDDQARAEKERVNLVMADLVSQVACEDALARLLSGERDRWVQASVLAARSPGFARAVERAKPEGPTLWVRWLQHPSGDDGYCLVLVYWPEGLHSEVALYNRARLVK